MGESGRHVYGSLHVGSGEFALAADELIEVVNPPASFTPFPLGPDCLLGLFNLRGDIIPVIDLAILLDLPVPAYPPENPDKIAVIERGGVLLGLRFERTGEVFRGHSGDYHPFAPCEGSVIHGVFKLEDGARIVQRLDLDALFRINRIPVAEAGEGGGSVKGRKKRRLSTRRQCVSFRAGPARCALRIDAIQEIVRVGAFKSGSPAGGLSPGALELRGSIIPVVDFAALLGYGGIRATAPEEPRRILILRQGGSRVGFLVESVESIVSYFEDELLGFPVLASQCTGMFAGCISGPGATDILLLDHEKVVSMEEVGEIARGHRRLYGGDEAGRTGATAAGSLSCYITFGIGGMFAVRIEDAREIIELPSEVVRPPGLPPHFAGVVSLRGEMIALVDARVMYGRAVATGGGGKVILFRRAEASFGLIVDSVDSIFSIRDSEKVPMPEILRRQLAGGMAEDVLEAICVSAGERSLSVLILNVDSIARRLAPPADHSSSGSPIAQS